MGTRSKTIAAAICLAASVLPMAAQEPDVLTLQGDSLALEAPGLPADSSAVAPRRSPAVTPVDIDEGSRKPILHYYDKHGEPLEEPVLFLATLDTVTRPKSKPVYPLYNGVSVGINFADGIMAIFGQKYGSYDVAVDVSLHNWFFPVIEAGIGYARSTPDNRNFTYSVDPSFYCKLGLNYNFLYKSNPDYQLYLGLRAAWSTFSWKLTGVNISSSYWQEQQRFDMTGLRSTAWWGEALAGLKVKIAGGFSLGWSVRWHFPFHFSKSGFDSAGAAGLGDTVGSKPWFVPGYGGNGNFTFTFSAIWTFGGSREPKPDKETELSATPQS